MHYPNRKQNASKTRFSERSEKLLLLVCPAANSHNYYWLKWFICGKFSCIYSHFLPKGAIQRTKIESRQSGLK